VATISSGNSTTLYSTTQTSTSVNTPSTVPTQQVNETNFTTLYSNTSASATGGGVSGNLLVSGNLRVLGTSDLEGSVTISNSYILPTSDGTNNQVVTTDGNGNLTFQDVDAIDNIPDGTAEGQVLFWNGSAWTAATTLTFDAYANRLRLVNNVSGLSAAVEFLKQYTTTLADGAKVGYLFGFTSGGAIVSPTNPIYTHRAQSEYDTGGNPIYRISVDPVGNFASGSTTVFTVSRLDNDTLGINGNEFIFLQNVTGAPTEDAVIRVNRGSSTDATITWDESTDRFEINTDLITTGVQGGNVQIAMAGLSDNEIYIGGSDLLINTDGSHIIQSNSPIKTTAQSMTINSDSTAADSYLYLKGTSVIIKYDNTDDRFELNKDLYATGVQGGNVQIAMAGLSDNEIYIGGSDLLINTDGSHIIQSNSPIKTSAEIISINSDSTAADSYLYMKGTSQYLKWDNSNNFFNLNADVFGSASIIANTYLATNGNNIYFNNDDVSAADSYLSVKRGASADVSVRWNQTASKWQFTNDGSTYYDMAVSIDDLADVVITPPVASGQFLVSDGTNWINDARVIATAAGDRPTFQYNNSTAGSNSALRLRKNYGATPFTTGDGSNIAFQVDSDSQPLQQIANIGCVYDATNPVIFLATNANANTAGPFLTAAEFSRVAVELAGTTVTLDSFNVGAANNSVIVANRGSSGTDATITWNEGNLFWNISNDLYVDGTAIGGTALATNGNNIYFNNEDVGAADSYLTVKRGASADVNLKWDESTDRWQTTTDGSTYLNIPNQNLDTTSQVDFAEVNIDGVTTYNSTTTTTTSTATVSISSTVRKSQKAIIRIIDNVSGEVHMLEALAFYKSTTAYLTTYAEMYSSAALATFTADVSGGAIRILATPASTNSTTFTVARFSLD